MTKVTQVTLPNWAAEEIERISVDRGIPFATAAKELLCEKLQTMNSEPNETTKQ